MILRGCPKIYSGLYPSGTIIHDMCGYTFKPCVDNKDCMFKEIYNRQLIAYHSTDDVALQEIIKETMRILKGTEKWV